MTLANPIETIKEAIIGMFTALTPPTQPHTHPHIASVSDSGQPLQSLALFTKWVDDKEGSIIGNQGTNLRERGGC